MLIVILAIAIHHSMHRGELAIIDWRFTLLISEPTKTISSLVVANIIHTCLEVVTRAKLLVISSILVNKILDLIVLRIQCIQQTVIVTTLPIVVLVLIVVVDWDICFGLGSCWGVSILFVLVIADKVIVCESKSRCLEVRLLSIWVHYVVHLIITLRATEAWAIVKELSLLVRILAVFGASMRLLTPIAHLELRLLLTFCCIALFLVWYMQLILGQLWFATDDRRYGLICHWVDRLLSLQLLVILESRLLIVSMMIFAAELMDLVSHDASNAVLQVWGADWDFGIGYLRLDQRMDRAGGVWGLLVDSLVVRLGTSHAWFRTHILPINCRSAWGGLASSRSWLVVREMLLFVVTLVGLRDSVVLFGIWVADLMTG